MGDSRSSDDARTGELSIREGGCAEKGSAISKTNDRILEDGELLLWEGRECEHQLMIRRAKATENMRLR
jgi:hypothetical protein